LLVRGVIYLKVDERNVSDFEREGLEPFTYATRRGRRGVMSYRRMPDRLYDDPEELASWARVALAAARRGGARKRAGASGAVRKAEKGRKSRRDMARSRHLGCARQICVGLANDSVATGALGDVEASVGAFDQCRRSVAPAQRGNPGRDRHAAKVLSGRTFHQ